MPNIFAEAVLTEVQSTLESLGTLRGRLDALQERLERIEMMLLQASQED